MRWVWVSAAILLLAACGMAPPDSQEPVGVVKRFVAGLEARDASAVLAAIAPGDERKQIAAEVRSYLGLVEQLEFRSPAYELLENTGELARVRLTATLHYAFKGTARGEQAADIVFEVVKSGDTWYLQNMIWPGPGQ